jgi:transglutaminase-like putative cysteine protease
MKFSHYTIALTYFMVSLGLWAVSLVEALGAPFITLAGMGAATSLAFNLRGSAALRGAAWNAIAASVVVLFALDYLAFTRDIVASASRFLTILLILKLFDLKKGRDYLIAYSLVFFQMLAAAASTASPVFFLLLSLFVLGSIWGMIIFNMKKDFEEMGPAAGDLPATVFGLPFFFSIIAVSIASLAVTLVLFFVIPRMGAGFLERKTVNTVKVAGFSEEVDMGAIGSVKTDPTVVMRVELPGLKAPPPYPLYFRGASLEHFDGRKWKRKTGREHSLIEGDAGIFTFGRRSGRPLEQRILLEPLDTEVVFAASNAVVVEGAFKRLWTDDAGSIYFASPQYARIEYRAWSDTSPVNPMTTPRPGPAYLDTGAASARVVSLAAGITSGAEDARQKALAIEGYLKSNHTYTLEPSSGMGDDPLDDFLFHSREGYCEHYATAMVMMLRAAGVPARMVTGFAQGEWNGMGAYFMVRQRDAHSWVEAYIEDEGWARFDPTPAAGAGAPTKASALTLYLDLLRWRWTRYIVQFSSDDQRRAAVGMEGRARMAARAIRERLSPARLTPGLVRGAGAAALAAAVIAVFIAALLSRMRKVGKTPGFYGEMIRILGRRGLARRLDETPLEFAVRTGNPMVLDLTRAFHAQRYGKAALSGRELDDVRAALDALRREGRGAARLGTRGA